MSDFIHDLEWHKEHKRLGFYDPIAELFEEMEKAQLSEEDATFEKKAQQTDDISRQAAIDAFYVQSDDDGWWTGTAQDMEDLLQGLPSTQPERKTGKWLRTDKYDINGNTGWECSCCGNITACNGVYCHACGAKMKGVEQERRTDEIN